MSKKPSSFKVTLRFTKGSIYSPLPLCKIDLRVLIDLIASIDVKIGKENKKLSCFKNFLHQPYHERNIII